MKSYREEERGAALLLSVLVLAILILLVGQMTITASHNRSVSTAALSDLQNTYGVRSGYYHARLYLEADRERDPEQDTFEESWAQPIRLPIPPQNAAVVWVQIEDVERKLNLSQLVQDNGARNEAQVERFRRLLNHLKHDVQIADRIADYMDKDTKGEFEADATNQRLYNLEELLRIDGIPREVLYGDVTYDLKGILEFVTLWPAEGNVPLKLNLNTAPVEVLMTLHEDMTLAAAEAIVRFRDAPNPQGQVVGFESAQDLENVDGLHQEIVNAITNLVDVKSALFEIHVKSQSATIEKSYLFVVERTQNELKRVASMQKNDFLWVKPPEEEHR